MSRVYIDGIFDLFHRGHLESLKKAKSVSKDTYLIVGVISDELATSYKREPIITHSDRIEIIKALKIVDKVIENPPLEMTSDFIKKYNIDLVVHGFQNEEDWFKQMNFFKFLIEENKFKRIDYYQDTSTTKIIEKIMNIN